MRRISGIGAVAGGAWVALHGLSALHRLGAGIPRQSLVAFGAIAAVLAVTAGVTTLSATWRGPSIVPLPKEDLVLCDPDEAEAIRAAAQLRGTLGGAGHVHPARLLLPASAWGMAGAGALAGPELENVAPWAAGVAVLAAASFLVRAKDFVYREAIGGRVVLHPAGVRDEIVRSARRADPSPEREAP